MGADGAARIVMWKGLKGVRISACEVEAKIEEMYIDG
jgi:hypothetical protein